MSTIGPNPQGWANEPAAKKKDNTWIYVLAAFFVFCLCVGFLASGIGLYSYLRNRPGDAFPDVTIPEVIPLQPTPVMATMVPAPTHVPTQVPSGPLPDTVIVDTYRPPLSGAEYYSLYQYAVDYNYEEQFSPVTNTYDIDMWARETVVIDSGWCTIDNDVLEQNFEHITFELVVDGESVDVNELFIYNEEREDRLCRLYSGIVLAWPLGEHVIIQKRIFDALINDGWNDYQPGEYTEIYNIHVTE